jgi:hypothetical protein
MRFRDLVALMVDNDLELARVERAVSDVRGQGEKRPRWRTV